MEKIELVQQEYNLVCHSHIYKYLFKHDLLKPENKKATFEKIRQYIPLSKYWLEDKIIPNRRAQKHTYSDTYPFRAWEYLSLCYVFSLPLNPYAETIYTMNYNESSMFFQRFEEIEKENLMQEINRACCEKFSRFIDQSTRRVGVSNKYTIREMQKVPNRHTLHIVEVEELTGMKNLKQSLNPNSKKGMYIWEYLYLCEAFGLSLNPYKIDDIKDIEIGTGIDFSFRPSVNVESMLLQ